MSDSLPRTAETIRGTESPSAASSLALGALRPAARSISRAALRALLVAERMLPPEPSAATLRAPSRVKTATRRADRERPAERGDAASALVRLRAPNRASGPRDLPRIFLLNPPRFEGIPVTRLFRSEYLFVQGNQVPAMDLAYFAAAAAGHAELALTDANGEDLTTPEVIDRLTEFRPDAIVQKGVLNVLHHDLAAAREYKRRFPHVKVLLSCRGAVDAEEWVFEEFPFVDGILRGEIDAFAVDVAKRPDLEGIQGLARPGIPSATIRVVEDLDAHPIPALELMPRCWYSGFGLAYYGVPSGYFLTASRGCPYTCTFCMVGGIDGRPFRHRRRDPKNVAEEARLARDRYGVRDFYVFDEIFTMPGHAEGISEAFIEDGAKHRFVCEGKPDLVSREMLGLMRRAGCIAVYYGVETGDDAILRDVEKGHTVDDSRRAIELTRAAKILAGAYVMLGFPGETLRSYLRTVRFLMETRPDLVRYDFLLPYPVTVLHREMVDAGLLQSGRREHDRRISPRHDEHMSYRSKALGAPALRALEFLLKQGFSRELMRSPVPTWESG